MPKTAGEIRAFRERYGLTQKDFGRLIGIRSESDARVQSTVSRWEAGVHPFPEAASILLDIFDNFPNVRSRFGIKRRAAK